MNHPVAQRLLLSALAVVGLLLGLSSAGHSQELEPRRWSHLPMDVNFAGGAYAYTTADIAFDPVLLLDHVEMEIHTVAVKYIRSFEAFGKSARIDFGQAYSDARWSGLLGGSPADTRRSGLNDSTVRLAINLFGAPPLKGKEFAAYRASVAHCETIVGVGLAVQLPTGHYRKDRLLNLGTNRFTFRPQLGVVHNRGKWSGELTASAWLFTDNDEFWDGNTIENDPLFTLQGHLVYTFRPGLWIASGVAYGSGLTTTVNGTNKHDQRENLLFGVSLGIPINRQLGFKIGYLGMRTQEDVGLDADTFVAAFSVLW